MAKNKVLITAMKAYRKQFDLMIPKIYASVVLAMFTEAKLSRKKIRQILSKSQELWLITEDLNDNGDYICKRCLEITGIDIRYGLNSEDGHSWDEKKVSKHESKRIPEPGKKD